MQIGNATPSGLRMQLHGTILDDATVRVQLDAAGHSKVVVQMHVLLTGPANLHATALQLFEPDQHAMAQAKAEALKRGATVELEADLAHMHISLHNATAKGQALAPTHPPVPTHTEPQPKNLWIQ